MIVASLLLTAAVAAAPVIRISPDQSVVTAVASEAELDDEALLVNQVSVLTSDGAKVKAAYTLRCGDSTWTWESRRTFELRRSAPHCTLSIRADGYRTAESALPGPRGKVMRHLERLPVLSGVVRDAQASTPLAGADILLPDETILATTDENGRFRVAVEQKWPSAVRVNAPGRAAKLVPVPKIVADTELTIAVSRGGTIALKVAPPLGEEPLKWEVRHADAGQNAVAERKGSLAAGQTESAIEALDPGAYHVVVMGEGPLQRIAVPVTVRDGEISSAEARIEPAVVEFEIRFGDGPLGNATADIRFGDRLWQSSVTTDADGRATEEIWQRGRYAATVQRLPEVRASVARREIAKDGVNSWTIVVADRKLVGRVTDDDGRPISGASVFLRATNVESSTVGMRLETRADGKFEFSALPEGTYRLSVSHEAYQTLETPAFPVVAETRNETRDLVLKRTAGREARVVTPRGAPVPNAAVFVSTQNGSRTVGFTDEQGRLPLPLSAHEAGLVFVLPRTGSIAMARFQALAEASHGHVEVRVPDGTASLEVRATSTEGEAIGGLSFLIAMDGVLLPPEVLTGLANYQGLPLKTSGDGRLTLTRLPPARYEVWPLTNRADYEAVRSAAPPPAPVNILLTPGHHTARLEFKPKN